MKRQELLHTIKELQVLYKRGQMTQEEYEAARVLLSSQLGAVPSFIKGMPSPAAAMEHKKTTPYKAFPIDLSNKPKEDTPPPAIQPPMSTSHHTLSTPPSFHPPPRSRRKAQESSPKAKDDRKALAELVSALKDLSQLHQMNVLSDDEFSEAKAPILTKIKDQFQVSLGEGGALDSNVYPSMLVQFLSKQTDL